MMLEETIVCPNCGCDELDEPYRTRDMSGRFIEHYECPKCGWKWVIKE